jgi:hypothetical protein
MAIFSPTPDIYQGTLDFRYPKDAVRYFELEARSGRIRLSSNWAYGGEQVDPKPVKDDGEDAESRNDNG